VFIRSYYISSLIRVIGLALEGYTELCEAEDTVSGWMIIILYSEKMLIQYQYLFFEAILGASKIPIRTPSPVLYIQYLVLS